MGDQVHDWEPGIRPSGLFWTIPITPSAIVSFEVTWPGHGEVTEVDDDVFDFSGRFIVSDATIAFTARNDGADVTYRSDPGGQIGLDAGVGRERNGIFH